MGNTGARIIEGWEQLVKTTESRVNKEEVHSMQQSSKMVRSGSKRGFKSEERGTSEIYMTGRVNYT